MPLADYCPPEMSTYFDEGRKAAVCEGFFMITVNMGYVWISQRAVMRVFLKVPSFMAYVNKTLEMIGAPVNVLCSS